jgi:hypothetical protein
MDMNMNELINEEKEMCPECGHPEVYTEIISEWTWEGRKKILHEWARNTCLNLDCGHFWPSDPVYCI